MWNVDVFQLFYRLQVAQFQFWHTATRFLFYQLRGNFVVRQHLEQIVADTWFVIVHVTGRVNGNFARRLRAGLHRKAAIRARRTAKFGTVVMRQLLVFMHAQLVVDQLACGGVIDCRVNDLHHHRYRCQFAHGIGAGEQLVAEFGLAFFILDRLGAQHGVRKIQIPRMRRHIRTFGHVAQVTQVALIDDLPVILFVDAINFQRRRFVHQVEQRREGRT